ncbi:MAG: ShlB/FhaC/HecB family hemolysin secretion/activation protein [Chlorobium sp.]
MFPRIITFVVLGSVCWGVCLEAETRPDAGSILLQQRPRPAQLQERSNSDSQPQQAEELSKPSKKKQHTRVGDVVRVSVKEFKFSGFKGLVSDEELQPLVSEYLGKSLSLGDLEAIADKVTLYLKDKGWLLAYVYLPAQDVTTGVIEINISQGKSVGSPLITGDKTMRICKNLLRRIAEKSCRPGDPLNEKDIERSVLLMNDLPGIAAQASLAPGSEAGSSKLDYQVKEGSLLTGVVWGDNYGNRYTGSWVGNTVLSVNDPFRYGDEISLTLNRSEGLVQGGVDYIFPLCANPGLTGNLSFTGMHYELLEEFADLDYEGKSYTVDAGLSYPVIRSRKRNVTTSVNYDYKTLTDTASNQDIRHREINRVTFSARGDFQDTFLHSGYTLWKLGVTTGNLHESIKDIKLTRAEGGYTRFNLMLSRLQGVLERVTFDISLSSQAALGNLDSSEKFYLGGPNSVRAYPLGEGSGDEGVLIKTDFSYKIPVPANWGDLQAGIFYDAGHITLNKERYPGDVITATNRNDYWLQGAGIGIRYDVSRKFIFQGSWAHVIGENPGRSTSGSNSDGQDDKSRFWLQGLMYF